MPRKTRPKPGLPAVPRRNVVPDALEEAVPVSIRLDRVFERDVAHE